MTAIEPLEALRRIAAYAVLTDDSRKVLLVRASSLSATPNVWSLPGGAVMHGEHPQETAVRETAAESGLSVAVSGLRDVLADMRSLPHRGLTIHTDRVIYSATIRGGNLRERTGQPTDLVRWLSLEEASELPLRPFTAVALGLPPSEEEVPGEVPEFPSFYAAPGPDGLHKAQRFAAYAVATDARERILLTRIAPNYPGAGRWHLPGGGTDYGEQPGAALIRELREETGQRGRLIALLGVGSVRDPASLGPEGYPIDWHGVRAFYRVQVDQATAPIVHDHGGSTSEARWVPASELASFGPEDLTEVTAEAIKVAFTK